MDNYISLVFQPQDFIDAQKTFVNYFGKDNPTSNNPDSTLYDGLEPTLWVDLATVAIPSLAGLISIWLGKGKKVIIKRKRGDSKDKVIIKNHDKDSTIEILSEFLNED